MGSSLFVSFQLRFFEQIEIDAVSAKLPRHYCVDSHVASLLGMTEIFYIWAVNCGLSNCLTILL